MVLHAVCFRQFSEVLVSALTCNVRRSSLGQLEQMEIGVTEAVGHLTNP